VQGFKVADPAIATPPVWAREMSQARSVRQDFAAALLLAIAMAPTGAASTAPVQTDDDAFTRHAPGGVGAKPDSRYRGKFHLSHRMPAALMIEQASHFPVTAEIK
jgi:hypothetical protein